MNLTKKQLLIISDVCLLLVAGLWGSSYGVAKNGLQFYPVLGFLTIRFGLTFLLLTPFLIKSYHNNKQKLQETVSIGLPLGGILLAIFICETFGVFYTSVSNAAFLISLCIVITPFMEWVVLKNKPHKLVFTCAIISLIGTYFLTIQTAEFSSTSLNVGDGLILLAALLRALMVVVTKKCLHNKQISSLNLTAIQSLIVFVGSLSLFIINTIGTQDTFYLPTSLTFWFSMLYLVLFCTIFAFFTQNWAVKIGTPSRASLLMGTEPAFGAIFAVLFFAEHISIIGWIGGAMITFSSIILIVKH